MVLKFYRQDHFLTLKDKGLFYVLINISFYDIIFKSEKRQGIVEKYSFNI